MSDERLSAASMVVLEMIAAGSTYEQILSARPDLTYLDIFRAAEEALGLTCNAQGRPRTSYTMAEKRERHRRAYEKWTDSEDDNLRNLVRSGATVARIAGELHRNRGAIRSRIVKLGLINGLTPTEQERLRRGIKIDGEQFGV